MKKKKILLVSSLYPSTQNPSYGIFVKRSEEGLAGEGFDFIKAVLDYKSAKILSKLLAYLYFYFETVRKGLFCDYDLIYGHFASHICIPIFIITFFKKSRLVINVHGGDLLPENPRAVFFYRLVWNRVLSLFLKRADLIISPSRYYRGVLEKRFGVSSAKVFVSPSGGVRAGLFAADRLRGGKEKLGLTGRFVAGYLSRLSENKGWKVFLKAVELVHKSGRIKNFSALIVGGGEGEEELRRLTADYGLENIIFCHKSVPPDRVAEFFNAMDLFVFPTLRKAESLGLVGIEALSCGLPVLASAMSGPTDYVIDGRNGYFFEPGNPDDLAEKIIRFYELSDEDKNNFSLNAVNSSKAFEEKKVVKLLAERFACL